MSLCDVAPGPGPGERPLGQDLSSAPSAQTKYLGLSLLGLAGPRIHLVWPHWLLGAVGREGGPCLGDKGGRVAEIDHRLPCSTQAPSGAGTWLRNLPLTQGDLPQPCLLGLGLPICRVGAGQEGWGGGLS